MKIKKMTKINRLKALFGKINKCVMKKDMSKIKKIGTFNKRLTETMGALIMST